MGALLDLLGLWVVAVAFLLSGGYMWGTKPQGPDSAGIGWPRGLPELYLALGVSLLVFSWFRPF